MVRAERRAYDSHARKATSTRPLKPDTEVVTEQIVQDRGKKGDPVQQSSTFPQMKDAQALWIPLFYPFPL